MPFEDAADCLKKRVTILTGAVIFFRLHWGPGKLTPLPEDRDQVVPIGQPRRVLFRRAVLSLEAAERPSCRYPEEQ